MKTLILSEKKLKNSIVNFKGSNLTVVNKHNTIVNNMKQKHVSMNNELRQSLESVKDKEVALIRNEMKQLKKVHTREQAAIHRGARADNKLTVTLRDQLLIKDTKINELQFSLTQLECDTNRYKTEIAYSKKTDKRKDNTIEYLEKKLSKLKIDTTKDKTSLQHKASELQNRAQVAERKYKPVEQDLNRARKNASATQSNFVQLKIKHKLLCKEHEKSKIMNSELQTHNDELEKTAATVKASSPICILQKECVNKKGGQKRGHTKCGILF